MIRPFFVFFVMPGLVPGIHVLLPARLTKDVDGRDKPGQDVERLSATHAAASFFGGNRP
jgi:hypothetical protein